MSARFESVSFATGSESLELWNESLRLCRTLGGQELAEWECAERFVSAFIDEWSRGAPKNDSLCHRVVERDNYRCTVPGCSARRDLHAHHVIWRSRGGPDEEWNLTTVCDTHHLEGIHAGVIHVSGDAPHRLVWGLGMKHNQALIVVGPGESTHSTEQVSDWHSGHVNPLGYENTVPGKRALHWQESRLCAGHQATRY